MNTKIIILLFATLTLTACNLDSLFSDDIKGNAIIVDNFKDKNPLEDIYIEVVEYYENNTFKILTTSTTDENGYFEINTECGIDIDTYVFAKVYSDSDYSDTLGSFSFYSGNYDYETIHLDTFSLSHNIWVIPRINSLGGYQPDEISIDYDNCELTDTALTNTTYNGLLYENQTLNPVEIKMTMNLQHWLTYGTRDLAFARLKKDSQQIAYGYFKLEDCAHTSEGDSLYINFEIEGAE